MTCLQEASLVRALLLVAAFQLQQTFTCIQLGPCAMTSQVSTRSIQRRILACSLCNIVCLCSASRISQGNHRIRNSNNPTKRTNMQTLQQSKDTGLANCLRHSFLPGPQTYQHADKLVVVFPPYGSRLGDQDGISTQTFEGSVAYIQLCEPACFILEMIWNSKIRSQFLDQLGEHCPSYALWSGVINSKLAAPTSRTRFYIIGINITKVWVT